jgi:hypothetical protein
MKLFKSPTPSGRDPNSTDRYDRIQRIVRSAITILLALFLIGLGTKFVEDVDRWSVAPRYEQQKSAETIAAEQEIHKIQLAVAAKQREIEDLRKTAEVAGRSLSEAGDSFRAWLATRGTLKSSREDPLVREKTEAVDRLRAEHEQWLATVDARELELTTLQRTLEDLDARRIQLASGDSERFAAAVHSHEIKQFAIRFGVALPVLLLAVFVFVKWRRAAYSPLAWGYIWFAVYVFFVGLVPYLPSFGGYFRYAVGAALTVVGGIYAIRQAAAYAARKQAELQRSREERAQQVSYQAAIAAFRAHTCPSCGVDYQVGAIDGGKPAHCFHCGIDLFRKCACGASTFAFFPYCAGCGAPIRSEAAGATSGVA